MVKLKGTMGHHHATREGKSERASESEPLSLRADMRNTASMAKLAAVGTPGIEKCDTT